MRHQVILRRGRVEGHVLAYCPELPGCSAAAATPAQALSLLRSRMARHSEQHADDRSASVVTLTSTPNEEATR